MLVSAVGQHESAAGMHTVPPSRASPHHHVFLSVFLFCFFNSITEAFAPRVQIPGGL